MSSATVGAMARSNTSGTQLVRRQQSARVFLGQLVQVVEHVTIQPIGGL
jgi:hypothetical protein